MNRAALIVSAGGTLAVVGLLAAAVVNRRGRATASVGPDGIVRWDGGQGLPADPRELASQAGAGIDVYALARLGASEAGSEAEKVAVMWATVNQARARKVTISQLLTRASKGGPSDGFFARQNVGGRFGSTARSPSAKDLEIARKVHAQLIPDPTGGARQWDSPKAQDALLAKGTPGYTKTAADVAAERSKTNDLVMVPGVPNTRFWRPKGVA